MASRHTERRTGRLFIGRAGPRCADGPAHRAAEAAGADLNRALAPTSARAPALGHGPPRAARRNPHAERAPRRRGGRERRRGRGRGARRRGGRRPGGELSWPVLFGSVSLFC